MINLIKNNIKKIILLSGSGSGIMFAGSRYHNNTTINSLDVIDNNNESSDMGIIGGGVVGLAIARELKIKYPEKKVILLEKENELGTGQTGHNSGVIHAGLYYKPNSLKALLCVEGSKLTYDYCNEKEIPYKKVGKLIVAKNVSEIESLRKIYKNAIENKVIDVNFLETSEEIKKIEPYCNGIKAIHSKNTGIIDWKIFTKNLAHDFREKGGLIKLNYKVNDIITDHKNDKIVICSNNNKPIIVKKLITCAGVYSDKIAKLTNPNLEYKIIPIRGEYLKLKKEKNYLVNGNIYPVPDPKLPFLGVHFTPNMNGDILLGPNAILCFSREGYNYSNINIIDIFEYITYSGFWKLLSNNILFGLNEIYKSIIIKQQIKQLQKYIPNITVDDVEIGLSGVRAQAVDKDGNLIEDFVFDESQDNIIHVLNAPSPAATSSMAIAKIVANKIK